MKYIYILLFAFLSIMSSYSVFAVDTLSSDDLRDTIIPSNSNWVITSTASWEWLLDAIFVFARDGIFSLMALIAIAVFLWIWGRLIVARWNPEEFKKALMSFVYAAVGIFVVAAAWAIVRFVAGINL